MKSIYDAFKTSEQAENEGQWFNYGTGPSGCDQRFLLARTSRANKKYTEAVRRMSEKYGRQIEAGTLADDVAYELMLKIFCSHVLIGWDGITTPDGDDLPYSVNAAMELMRALPDLYEDLQRNAASREHYLQKQVEEDAGN